MCATCLPKRPRGSTSNPNCRLSKNLIKCSFTGVYAMISILRFAILATSLLGAVFLSGCANHPLDCSLGISHHDCLPGTAGYRATVARQNSADEECRSYGTQFGTAEYAQCRQNLSARQSAREAAVLGAAMSQTNKPSPTVAPPVRQPTQTSCVTNGQYTNCQSQ